MIDIDQYIYELDQKAVVYNPLSGDTHEVNIMAADILRELKSTLSFEQLFERIAVLYEIIVNEDLAIQIERLVQQFDELGLIEPVYE